jgi:hypothetical protein
MNKLLVLGLVALGVALGSSSAFAQRRKVDEFANRRQYEQWQQQVRKEQAQANRRNVPTFTIPQPAYGGGYYPNYGYPNYGGGIGNGNYEYVLVPAGYQMINGQMQYVPARYVLVPRYGW